MTEPEAYQRLGWPAEGKMLVLPLSGSKSDRWMTTRCTSCPMVGLTLEHAYTGICACGGKQEEL